MSRGWLFAGLVLVLSCWVGGIVDAYQLGDWKWPDARTTFHVNIPGANGGWDAAFQEAMDSWTGATVFTYQSSADFGDPCNDPAANPAINGVGFRPTVCGDAWGSNVLAVTHTWGSAGALLQAGIVFNSGKTWGVYSGPWQFTSVDFRRVAVHELGHALGLKHETQEVSIMRPIIGDLETPADDDVAGVLALYGPVTDSDGDGIADSWDNCMLVTNPTQLDADSDGYGNRCDGDLGTPAPGNGSTNAQDYALFRAKLGTADAAADLNGNGIVNAQDYAIFRTLLGSPPGPSGLNP